MVWITALALAALNTQVSNKNDIFCDLAPFVGRGSSSEGSLDTLSGLGLGCRFTLYSSQQWSVGPRLDLTEQRWTVFRNAQETTYFTSYQARSLGLALNLEYAVRDNWKLGYSIGWAQGQGYQDQNVSNQNSTQNLHLSRMSHKAARHELHVSRRYNERISFLAGFQLESARQAWDTASGRLEQQTVAPGNRLTLTSGTGSDLDECRAQGASYRALSFKLGIQMRLH